MTNPSADQPTRRQVLRTGTIGLAAAAFLAACSKEETNGGQSGTPVASTSTPPTVPTLEPTQAALDLDQTVLRTGSSMELLAAEVYTTYGPQLADGDWQDAATRFAADHEDNAKVFRRATQSDKRIDVPNAYLRDTLVTPVEELLTDDEAILDFFRDIESTIAATYVTAAGSFTTAEWRAQVSAFASASARRVAVLGNGGEGQAPDAPLYPLADLVSNDAYVQSTTTTTAPA